MFLNLNSQNQKENSANINYRGKIHAKVQLNFPTQRSSASDAWLCFSGSENRMEACSVVLLLKGFPLQLAHHNQSLFFT